MAKGRTIEDMIDEMNRLTQEISDEPHPGRKFMRRARGPKPWPKPTEEDDKTPTREEKQEGGSIMERATYNIGGYGDGSSIFSPDKRQALQEGGALLTPLEQEGIPEDTYTPEDQANAEASQLPDEEMESKFVDFILDDALESEEQDYLMGALEADPRLSEIFDKVVETASEFTGEGPVEGPGTGVSDSIPARLSDGEFVMTKKATDQIGADELQTIMDEAERAFDGGLQGYVFGGIAEDDGTEKSLLGTKDEEEIKKQMITANRMPSVV